MPELYPGANDIGYLFSEICLAVIAGLFFYAIVNQYKENKDFENLAFGISSIISRIIHLNWQLLNEVAAQSTLNFSIPLIEGEIESMLLEIENGRIAPRIAYGSLPFRRYTWLELISTNQEKVKSEISRLLRFSNYLDSKLLKILLEMEESQYFSLIDEVKKIPGFNRFHILKRDLVAFMAINIDLTRYAYDNRMIDLPDEEMLLLREMLNSGLLISDIKKNRKHDEK